MGENVDEVSKASLDAKDAEAKGEQRRIGVMDKTLNQFQDAVTRVSTALDRLKNTIVRVTTDAFEPLITWAGEFFTKASHTAADGIDELAEWIRISSKQFGIYTDKWWFAVKDFFGPKMFERAGLALENGFLTILANIMEAIGSLLDKVGLGGGLLTAAKNMRTSILENNKAFEEAKKAEAEKLEKDKKILDQTTANKQAELDALLRARQARRTGTAEARTARVAPAEAQAGVIAHLKNSGITDPRAIANVLAMIQGETGFRQRSEDSLAGTATSEIRNRIFKNNKGIAGLSDAQIDEMKKGDSSALYNIAYDDKYRGARNKLGNTEPGEGFKYRGRGFHQLTGKSNYAAASRALYGDDRLVKNPDLVNDPKVAGMVAAWYYSTSSHAKGRDLTNFKDVYGMTAGNSNNTKELQRRSGFANQFLQQLTPQTSGNTTSGPDPVAPQSSSNQESAVNPVANLNTSLDNMVTLMREQVTQQKNLVTAIKRLNGNVQTAVT
jgi:predicted chitinase